MIIHRRTRPVLLAFVYIGFLLLGGCGQKDTPTSAVAASEQNVNDHVTFYGVGKVARYQQHMDSSLEQLGPLFFAEIFIATGGEVTDASIKFPPPVNTIRNLEYRYSESEEIGDVMYLSGRAGTDELLEQEFPSGAFEFTFSTPGGNVVDSVVSFAGASFPTQPVIIFEQGNNRIPFDQVDSSLDLVITWPPFT